MTTIERLQAASVRVQHGTTITEIIKTIYGNKRRYRESTTPLERAELSRLRAEYLGSIDDVKRNKYPRFHIDTQQELRDAVVSYCKGADMTIARFINNAIREKLNRARGKVD